MRYDDSRDFLHAGADSGRLALVTDFSGRGPVLVVTAGDSTNRGEGLTTCAAFHPTATTGTPPDINVKPETFTMPTEGPTRPINVPTIKPSKHRGGWRPKKDRNRRARR